ncbi:SGNH/GDSL hydrolase family protein [Bryobacter aggregatus]|uniref:SGNH/GDSL hydrolase family protein n=1 Tax=Bryobacter aggregatus TaxID=360054 RepID=UPI001EE2F69B|nr:SGNH/GDSL hydrolase family protein [Bryobacter aggregatus]
MSRINRRQFSTLLAAPLLAQTAPDLDWHDAKKFTVEGLGFKDLKSPYDRLPLRAEGVVRQAVWDLSRDSSGVLVRFTSNTGILHARWTLTNKNLAAPTITAVASSGLDVYAKTDAGKWHWLSIGKPTKFPDNQDVLSSALPPGQREYAIYLPLRNGVSSLEIGVSKGAAISPGAARPAGKKPIAFYATSITHGISASRPGMTHPAILGRVFDREIINLGFSGNGKMEPEVTKFLAELDPAVFILDCLPNMTAKDIHKDAANCVKTLRAAHPTTPILLVEDRNYDDNIFNKSRLERNETNHAAMREVYAKMKAEKIPNLHYLKADDLLGHDGEATIDGSHPTDLGFMRQAKEFEKALRKILK